MSYPLWVHRVDAITTLAVRRMSWLLARLTFSSVDKLPTGGFAVMIFFAVLQLDSSWRREGILLWIGTAMVVLFPIFMGIILGALFLSIQYISGGMDQHFQNHRLGRGHAAWSFLISILATIWLCRLMLPGFAGSATFLAIAFPVMLTWEVFLTRNPDDDYDLTKGPPRRKRRRVKKVERVFELIPGYLQPQH